jgi:hypothetical protein
MIQMIDLPLPTGQRFSQVYIQRGEPTQDSPRMRRRLAALVDTFPDLSGIQVVVPQKLGVDVPIGMGGVAFSTLSRSRIGTYMQSEQLASLNTIPGIVGAVKCSGFFKKRTSIMECSLP